MNNSYIMFGISVGFYGGVNQIFDKLNTNVGYIEYSTLWSQVALFLLVGTVIAIYRKVKG